MGYVVFRAMDQTRFTVDRNVRNFRSEMRADWNAFLDQFPDPEGTLRDLAFQTFIASANAPDYENLVPKNRLLQILASFPDMRDAFTRLNPELIQWDSPTFADRVTRFPGPGDAVYVPQANLRLFVDRSLPSQGTSAYFYRVRAVDALGNAGPMGASTPPVWLRNTAPLPAPRISAIQPGDRHILLEWPTSRDARAAEYQVHRARLSELNQNAWTNVADLPISATVGDRASKISVDDTSAELRPYVDFAYKVKLIDSDGGESESAVRIGRAFDHSIPAEPTWQRTAWVRLDDTGQELPWDDAAVGVPAVAITLTHQDAKVALLVEREDSGSWMSVGSWLRTPSRDAAADNLDYTVHDIRAEPSDEQRYRVKVMSYAGIPRLVHDVHVVAAVEV